MAAVLTLGVFFFPFPWGGFAAAAVVAVVFVVWRSRRGGDSFFGPSVVELHFLKAGEERRLPAVLKRASSMTLGRRRIVPFGNVYILEDLRSGYMSIHDNLEECVGVAVDDLDSDSSWNEIVDRYRDV